jgi:hypothetical protein
LKEKVEEYIPDFDRLLREPNITSLPNLKKDCFYDVDTEIRMYDSELKRLRQILKMDKEAIMYYKRDLNDLRKSEKAIKVKVRS